MAWNNSIVTDTGTTLLNESLAGHTLSITSAAGGTGTVDQSELVKATGVLDQKQTLRLLGIEDIEFDAVDGKKNGKKIGIQISNQGLEEGYLLQQVAVFARLDSEELDTLLFIMQDEKGIFIPSISENSDFLLEIYAVICIANDANISVTMDMNAVVSPDMLRGQIQQAIKEHNNDLAAHEVKRHVIAERTRDPGKPHYGLGGGGDEAVALDTSPYTGTTEIGVVVSGTEYDADNLSENKENAKSGILIVQKMEE